MSGKYKQNMIRKIPQDWEVVRLGEISYISSGNTAPQDKLVFEDGNIPFIRVQHINKLHKGKYPIVYDLITYKMLKRFKLKIFKKGSIIFPKSGESIKLERRAILDNDSCVVNHFAVIEIVSSRVNNLFLFYYLMSVKLSNLILQTTMPSLPLSSIQSINLLLPPLPEQEKIAEILSTIDNAIDKTDKIIEKYKRIKQGLMQELLTKGVDDNFRIRSEQTHKFKDSPLGRIPEEWEVVRLGSIATIRRGASPRPIDDPIYFAEQGRGWVRIIDVTSSTKYLTKTTQYLSIIGERKSVKIEPDELIMSICATIGKPIITKIQACIHDGFVVFKNMSPSINLEYLFYYLDYKSNDFKYISQVGTQGNLNTQLVAAFKILLPSLSEQKLIASILSKIDEAIEKEQKYKAKLERIKQGLMHDLLTGKVRVNKLIESYENVQKAR